MLSISSMNNVNATIDETMIENSTEEKLLGKKNCLPSLRSKAS